MVGMLMCARGAVSACLPTLLTVHAAALQVHRVYLWSPLQNEVSFVRLDKRGMHDAGK